MKYHLLVIRMKSAIQQRDRVGAMALFDEARVLSRELKNRRNEGEMLNWLGEMARHQRAYEQALVFYHECLALSREIGDMGMIAVLLCNMGLAALGQGDWPRATSLFRESMALAQEMKSNVSSLWNVWGLARVALAEGQTRRAAQLLAADGLLTVIKDSDPADLDDNERDVAWARTRLGEEAFAAAWAEGRAMSLEEIIAYAMEEGGAA
jgi:tetratricopeptide (TPR) repeat protein